MQIALRSNAFRLRELRLNRIHDAPETSAEKIFGNFLSLVPSDVCEASDASGIINGAETMKKISLKAKMRNRKATLIKNIFNVGDARARRDNGERRDTDRK